MHSERDYFWFRLFKTRGIGPKRLAEIANILEEQGLHPEKLPRSQNALSSQCPELAEILNGKIRAEDQKKIETDYKELKRRGTEIISPGHPDFSSHLLETSPILFVKGQRKLLTTDGVAIVGSRNVSEKGVRIAEQLAAGLAGEGMNVVSGYAKGVDSAAHLGALAAEGTTTLVLPYGIKELRQKKAFREFNWEQDVLAVSQFDPDARWLARNAMTRNKLVCALSKAVVVIASGPERDARGKMSGTFDTAKTALGMNVPLFVLDPERFDTPPQGNAALIELGGVPFDAVNGVAEIVARISIKQAKSTHSEVPNYSVQLLFQGFKDIVARLSARQAKSPHEDIIARIPAKRVKSTHSEVPNYSVQLLFQGFEDIVARLSPTDTAVGSD